MSIRVRFAPSPTGQVHIGNIRAAIFNWLFARHNNGTFLLRVEDTDLERSTPQAIQALLQVMEWLGLNYDEPIFYQTSQSEHHCQVAMEMLERGLAYKDNKGGDSPAILFQFPYQCDDVPGVERIGEVETALHPDVPLHISRRGVDFATVSPKGKAAPAGATLAGFLGLKAYNESNSEIFDLESHLAEVNDGAEFNFPEARKITYVRRAISYNDLVKGLMTKPLDALKDFVIIRSDGSPVFHLANVLDDITQNVTHIIRGDDHVENTFKHIFLFHAVGAPIPQYGHLPMIINAQGKPYSKRDGDAFVGDFKDKGFTADTLFNYLSLLGWSPGDNREKMSRQELIEAFTLERCLRGPSQMDIKKLTNLNGQYIAEMPADEFRAAASAVLAGTDWGKAPEPDFFGKICDFMQSRVKRLCDVTQWEYFFVELPTWDPQSCGKLLSDATQVKVLRELAPALQALPEWSAAALEAAVDAATTANGIPHGKLNQPLRAAVTGTNIGAGIFETLELIGRDRTVSRLAQFPA